MTNEEKQRLEELQRQIHSLTERQTELQLELTDLKIRLKKLLEINPVVQPHQPEVIVPPQPRVIEPEQVLHRVESIVEEPASVVGNGTEKRTSDFESFIGENLMSKVGIAITITGVAFGAKYAIDHGLLSPAIRIMLGYLVGALLLFLSYKLKEKYHSYSAVLNGGAYATIYLITFSAYNYYQFFPLALTFILMVAVTAAAVYSALRYDSQVLAQIAMVGAYAVPFLLSDNSGRVVILFSYMSLINIGILIIAFRKSWSFLFYSSFLTSWIIMISWGLIELRNEHIAIGYLFSTIFYLTFYLTFLSRSWIRNEPLGWLSTLAIVFNSILYYAMGLRICYEVDDASFASKVFTALNIVLPLIAYLLFSRRKSSDVLLMRTLMLLFTFFLVLTNSTLLDNQWATLGYGLIAFVYLFISRRLKIVDFGFVAYPLFLLAVVSQINDWNVSNDYDAYDRAYHGGLPFLNLTFFVAVLLTSMIGISLYGLKRHESSSTSRGYFGFINSFWPFVFLGTLYFTLNNEVAAIWVEKYHSLIDLGYDRSVLLKTETILRKFSVFWTLIFSMAFMTAVTFYNIKNLRSRFFAAIVFGASLFFILSFITRGLRAIVYIKHNIPDADSLMLNPGVEPMRYCGYVTFGILLWITHRHTKMEWFKKSISVVFDIVMHLSILLLASSELIRILEISEVKNAYKYGLTILWGCYALFLIVLGIWKKIKHLRILGMAVFAMTVGKLLLYDLDQLSTIARAGLFILIGGLLLLVSYLYIRFRSKIFEEG